jgi:hypothetical protein
VTAPKALDSSAVAVSSLLVVDYRLPGGAGGEVGTAGWGVATTGGVGGLIVTDGRSGVTCSAAVAVTAACAADSNRWDRDRTVGPAVLG